MKTNKIWDSGLGIVLAVLAVLIAGRVVRLVSWSLVRMCGYAVIGGILVFALSGYAERD